MSMCILGRWGDLAEMFRNMSVSAFRLKFFFIYFWGWWTMGPVFSCYCRYHCWPHGQPAGLIRLRGHLLLLASFPGPRDSGPRYWGPHCSTGSEIISGRWRMEEKWLSVGFFFQSKRILVSVNLVLYLGNPVLLRSVLIAVHEEQSCVLTLSALVHLT